MNHDKAALGSRYTCFQCGTKFYDLNRPEPTCPECNADQREAPVRDVKSLLQGGLRSGITDSGVTSSVDTATKSTDTDDLGLDGDDDDNESYNDDDSDGDDD